MHNEVSRSRKIMRIFEFQMLATSECIMGFILLLLVKEYINRHILGNVFSFKCLIMTSVNETFMYLPEYSKTN